MRAAAFPTDPVLLVDDEKQLLASAEMALASEGITNLVLCADSREALPLLATREFSAVLLDITMAHLSGTDLLPRIVGEHPGVPVIMMTGVNEVETAVQCMKDGAFDYLVKPVDEARLAGAVRRAIEIGQVRRENSLLKKALLSGELEHPEAFAAIVTQSPGMRSIFQYAEAIASSSLPVLVTGETGTGKELVALALHALNGRSGAFVPVNAAGLDDTLFSDALFGHKKGGFTGAERDRPGLIEQAAGGTLFLDEIGDLAAQSQIKLLRLLQEGRYYPIGSDMQKASDARVVVATNRDLHAMQEQGEFRKDLYYRLRTHHIHLPPLRKRREDLPLLLEHFLSRAAASLGKKAPTPPRELFALLGAYAFPGNIRELEGMVFDAVSRHKSGVMSLESFREKIGGEAVGEDADIAEEAGAAQHARAQAIGMRFPDTLPTLKDAEESLIDEALRRAGGNQSVAAGLLGLSRRALNNRLRRGPPQGDPLTPAPRAPRSTS
jgi:two-component system nitrogen regulation response regulator GlnG